MRCAADEIMLALQQEAEYLRLHTRNQVTQFLPI